MTTPATPPPGSPDWIPHAVPDTPCSPTGDGPDPGARPRPQTTGEPPDNPEAGLDQRGRPRDVSRGGRPTKFTTPRVVAILAALWDGANRADAARKAGVSPAAFYVWLQLGRAGHPTFAPLAAAVATVEQSRGIWGVFRTAAGRRGFWKALS